MGLAGGGWETCMSPRPQGSIRRSVICTLRRMEHEVMIGCSGAEMHVFFLVLTLLSRPVVVLLSKVLRRPSDAAF